jgi:hypothetical protein
MIFLAENIQYFQERQNRIDINVNLKKISIREYDIIK